MAVQPKGLAMLTLRTSELLTGAVVGTLTLFATPALGDGMAHGSMDWLAPLDHYCERVARGSGTSH